ncbi:ComF family protein [Microbacterium amylolyticum]|uniref:Amidophosphoribosyltransferase n=1 Tax=Microbacterium amylolyticum TaxID=936337 RepID=A0ABS4ZKP6_9MICO|nr:phosphoribosyltransferase family protein [Microbacterium amylolyticum]MBP2437598.1 putative amidophosphoribosyltransferase [Microbacterium amylolyticum]
MTSLRHALDDAMTLLFPVECAGCAEPTGALCETCRQALCPIVVRLDIGDGASPPLAVYSALRLDGAARHAIRALKQRGRTGTARALGEALGAAVRAAREAHGGGADVVPVPTSRAALRRRGYAVPDLLVRRAGTLPLRALTSARIVADQRGLGRRERRRNVAHSMRARLRPGTRVILADDVLTTGATLLEARRAIEEAGGIVIAAVTVADTPGKTEHDGDAENT